MSSTPSRVFITGALGFIGRTLAARYRADGAEVVGVDRVADESQGVVAGDVSEPGAWQAHAAGADLVIHTAAVVSNAADADLSWRMNVLGTRRALDAARDAGAGRFVHFSSIRAFSDLDFPDGVDETWPVRTDGNPYVDTKVAAEQVALQAHAAGEVDVTVIRPGDVYGPGSRPWTILPVEAIKSRQFLLPAGGRGIFSPVYVDTLVDGVVLAAAHPDGAGQIFTLSDGIGVTCLEFFSHYTRMLGGGKPVCVPTPLAVALAEGAGRVARLRGQESEAGKATVLYFTRRGTYSIEKARRVLGFEPAIDLAEGMRRTEAWLRAEGYLDR